jgi:hypothetical protein
MDGWSKERLRLLLVILDCIDELRLLERTSGPCTELVVETVQRLEQGLKIIRWEVAHPFLGPDRFPPSRILH